MYLCGLGVQAPELAGLVLQTSVCSQGSEIVVRPKLLDLFCKAGGCSVGYHRAGFDVFGVDIEPQPRYPFSMVVADALLPPFDLKMFDVIHASPPCQAYSQANNIWGYKDYPDLVAATRSMLEASGKMWVIENVPGAPLQAPALICGLALGLNVKRHRLFESSHLIFGTTCPKAHRGNWVLVFGNSVLERGTVIGKAKGGGPAIRRKHIPTQRGKDAMGIDWMTRAELSQAIPPAYTEYIGNQLIRILKEGAM